MNQTKALHVCNAVQTHMQSPDLQPASRHFVRAPAVQAASKQAQNDVSVRAQGWAHRTISQWDWLHQNKARRLGCCLTTKSPTMPLCIYHHHPGECVLERMDGSAAIADVQEAAPSRAYPQKTPGNSGT